MGEQRFSTSKRGKGLVGVFVVASMLAPACSKSDEAPPSTTTSSAAEATAAPPPATATATTTAAAPIAGDLGGGKMERNRPPAAFAPPEAPRPGGAPMAGAVAVEADDLPRGGEKKDKAKAARGPAQLAADPFAQTITPKAPARAPLPEAAQQPKVEAALNANGRFATTYRPGGGHLTAFEAAVSRGVVPEGERELVSDVGARYSADVPAPTAKTMTISTDLERGKLPPSGGPFHARLTLRSTTKAAAERPHLSVHLVLDISGSMAGKPMDQARKAAQALVDKLAPTDDFSLVTFSSDAKVEVADKTVGPNREAIKKVIEGIKEGGGTNIGAGLTLGYEQAKAKSIPKDAVRVVMLLSDGHVNAGILDRGKLSQLALDAFQDGVQTSSFGLGADYDGPLMSSIAADGAGGYYYLRESDQIAPALAAELDKRLDPVATAVEVRVRLKKGVELLHVYGSRRLNEAEAARVRAQEVAADKQAEKRDGIKADRQDDQEGGMRFFMPAFARDESHALLLKLRVAEGVGSKPLALVEIKYKDRVSKKNVSEEFPVGVEYAGSDADSFATRSASVVRTVQGFAAGEALAQAAALVNAGQREAAAALLSEREGILREAAGTLAEPLFLKDADRMARLRSHSQATDGMGDPLVLAMLLETASNVHLR